MTTFPLIAQVKRIIVDTVCLDVEADTAEEAMRSAYKCLEVFPLASDQSNVTACQIVERHYDINSIADIKDRYAGTKNSS